MKILSLSLLSLFLTASAFASPVSGSCNLVNALGVAKLTIERNGGEIRGINGSSPIREVRAMDSVGFVQILEIAYESRIGATFGGGHDARVQLALVASPGTALMGVNYQGMVLLPLGMPALAFPGPFSYSGGGWLNPVAPFVPTVVPAGYAPIAAAYCNLR